MGDEDTIAAVLQFVQYAYLPHSDFTGTVQFHVLDSASGINHLRTIEVRKGEGVTIHAERPPSLPVNCTVKVEKAVLLAILTGAMEPAVAFLWGQISVDNVGILTQFVSAFALSRQKFEEFQQSLASQANGAAQPDTSADEPCNNEIITPAETARLSPPLSQITTVAVDPPKISELKKNLAIGGLRVIISTRKIVDEVDQFIDRVKESDQFKKSVAQLNKEASALADSDFLTQIRANPQFNLLKVGFELGISKLGAKAKVAGIEFMEALTSVAYSGTGSPVIPRSTPAITTVTVVTPSLPPPDPSVVLQSVLDKTNTQPRPLLTRDEKQTLEDVLREDKRRQLMEKLDSLKKHNKEMEVDRKERVEQTFEKRKLVQQ